MRRGGKFCRNLAQPAAIFCKIWPSLIQFLGRRRNPSAQKLNTAWAKFLKKSWLIDPHTPFFLLRPTHTIFFFFWNLHTPILKNFEASPRRFFAKNAQKFLKRWKKLKHHNFFKIAGGILDFFHFSDFFCRKNTPKIKKTFIFWKPKILSSKFVHFWKKMQNSSPGGVQLWKSHTHLFILLFSPIFFFSCFNNVQPIFPNYWSANQIAMALEILDGPKILFHLYSPWP